MVYGLLKMDGDAFYDVRGVHGGFDGTKPIQDTFLAPL